MNKLEEWKKRSGDEWQYTSKEEMLEGEEKFGKGVLAEIHEILLKIDNKQDWPNTSKEIIDVLKITLKAFSKDDLSRFLQNKTVYSNWGSLYEELGAVIVSK